MAIALSKLCTTAETTYEMQLVAGYGGMENLVRWVHIIEDAAVPSFLRGNELVFTTGIGQEGTAWLLRFAQDLCDVRAAGLVLNVGPYITSVPSPLIVFCQQHDLPLFRVPWKTHLIDITYDFCHRIISAEKNEITVASAFRNLIFTPEKEELYRPILERAGFRENGGYCAAVFQQEEESEAARQQLSFQAHRLLGRLGHPFSLFFQNRQLVAILLDCAPEEAEAFAGDLTGLYQEPAENGRVSAGVGTLGLGYTAVPRTFQQASAALGMAVRKGHACLQYGDLGVYKLLLSVKNPDILRELEEEFLGPLKEYDAQNGTDYIDTLRCYLEHDASVQILSRITGVHRNTINYKMKQIRKILGVSLTEEIKLELFLAFYMQDLLK